MAERLQKDQVGSLAYRIYADNELVADVSAEDPIEYLHGHDNIVPGLEEVLEGLRIGDTFDVTVPPEKGYGEYDEANVEEIPADEFDFDEEDIALEVGLEVEMLDEEGNIIEGTILAIEDDVVTVDMNPPLAGKTIRYEGSVVSIRGATEEELEWGLPESLLDEMFGEEDEFDFDEDDEDE